MYNLIIILIMLVCRVVLAADTNVVLRDPTQPPGVVSYGVYVDDIRIDAIFYSKNVKNSSVIIGGRRLGVGDKIMAATIVEIKPYEIKLRDDKGGEFIATMTNSDTNIKTQTKYKINKKKKS
jgi:hypothetical protein